MSETTATLIVAAIIYALGVCTGGALAAIYIARHEARTSIQEEGQ